MFGAAGHCCPQCCPHCHVLPVVAHPVLTTVPNSSPSWPEVSCGPRSVPSRVRVGVWALDSVDGSCPVLVSLKANSSSYV